VVAAIPDRKTIEPPTTGTPYAGNAGGPITLDPIDERPPVTSYSLIGW
jgi:hypothetical protein